MESSDEEYTSNRSEFSEETSPSPSDSFYSPEREIESITTNNKRKISSTAKKPAAKRKHSNNNQKVRARVSSESTVSDQSCFDDTTSSDSITFENDAEKVLHKDAICKHRLIKIFKIQILNSV